MKRLVVSRASSPSKSSSSASNLLITRQFYVCLILVASIVLFNYHSYPVYEITDGITLPTSSQPQQHEQSTTTEPVPFQYIPAHTEAYVLKHSSDLLYNGTNRDNMTDGCAIWLDPNASSIYNNLQTYQKELEEYNQHLKKFNGTVKDLRQHMTKQDKSICDTLDVHPKGLQGIFQQSKSLSNMKGSSGYIEPLITPLRHPGICRNRRGYLMHMGYLVHDFAAMCRNKLHPHSRTVFIDMGAALDFHGRTDSPAVYITHMYQKFGFHFDHIYAYEMREKKPYEVYERIPDDLKAAYHWYNVGVDANISSSYNPLKLLLESYNEDDFVVVKLDIDTSFIEVPMVHLVRNDERLQKIIDAFYFEHHVLLKELSYNWGRSMGGSVKESLELFSKMRENGVASHYWP